MPLLFPQQQAPQQQPLYGYDLGRIAESEQAQRRLQHAQSQPLFSGGGLMGAGLQRRQMAEEDFQRAIQMARHRRAVLEHRRRTQEADIEAARRRQAVGLVGGGISSLVGSAGGLIAGYGTPGITGER